MTPEEYRYILGFLERKPDVGYQIVVNLRRIETDEATINLYDNLLSRFTIKL